MTRSERKTAAASAAERICVSVTHGVQPLHSLLMCSAGRVLAKKITSAPDGYVTTGRDFSHRNLRHVADWLNAAFANSAPWLSNVDPEGRPRKLLKFGTMEALLAEVDRDMARLARSVGKGMEASGGTEIHMELGDGWRIVRLLTPEALDYESSMMGHCIGNGGYDSYLRDGGMTFLSLRDPRGKPHATLALEGGELVELSGKQNDTPSGKYLMRMASFLATLGDPTLTDGSYGFVMDIDGGIHANDDLPDRIETVGDIVLSNADPFRVKHRLPLEIRAGGNVVIEEDDYEGRIALVRGTNAMVGGKGLLAPGCVFEIERNLDLAGTDLETLPDGLSVAGDLDLSGSSLKELPAGLSVGGVLRISSTDIKRFPEDLSAPSIRMDHTDIKSLGNIGSLKELIAVSSGLAALPESLFVEGLLDISEETPAWWRLKHIEIPAGLVVGGALVAHGRKVRLPTRLAAHVADFSHCDVTMPTEFEATGKVILNAASMDISGRSISCADGLDMSAAHFVRLPRSIRATSLNMERRLARPMPILDCDIDAGVLVLSNADCSISDRVVVRDAIHIVDEAGTWRFPVDGAKAFLADRGRFPDIFRARDHFRAIPCLTH